MGQKSSVPQAAKSVSQALMSDTLLLAALVAYDALIGNA
jgi:hypothetical protein